MIYLILQLNLIRDRRIVFSWPLDILPSIHVNERKMGYPNGNYSLLILLFIETKQCANNQTYLVLTFF